MRPFHLVCAAGLLGGSAACSESAPPPFVAPPVAIDTTGIPFVFTPPAGGPTVGSVALAGTFNGWSTTATAMVRRPDGTWRAWVPLAEGLHEFKFHINGAWPADMCYDRTWGDPARQYRLVDTTTFCVDDGNGGQNAVRAVGTAGSELAFAHSPTSPALLSEAGGLLSVRFRANTGRVRSATVRAGATAVPMHRQLVSRLQETWRGTLPSTTASYSIEVETATGTQSFGPYAVPGMRFRAVSWVGGGVGYQIFPDRFANGDPRNDSLALASEEFDMMPAAMRGAPPVVTPQWDGPVTDRHCCHQYFGGDLQGVIGRLDYLQSLGVTLLYFNPIFLAGSTHGYDTWDYRQIDPALGDTTTLRALLVAAEARGMRIMWDFVPNHVGVGHPPFRDAATRGPVSPTWSWFTFKVPPAQVQIGNGTHYEAFWGFGSMPKLDTRVAAVREHLLGAVRQWTTFGLQGIRVDVPNELWNAPEFFREFRQAAKTLAPETYLVGEIWQRNASWLQGDQFDALMNYAIGQDVIERFVMGRVTAGAALSGMAQLYAEYPEASAAMQFNVISTHDNARLLTKMGGGELGATAPAEAHARQRLASAMLYALPGVPVTFQGDECAQLGGTGGREENRYPVQWARCDATALAHYRLLGRLRRETPALQSSAIRLRAAEGTLLSWLRGEPGVGEVLTVFNGGATLATTALPPGQWTDLVTTAPETGTLTIPAVGWRWLRRN